MTTENDAKRVKTETPDDDNTDDKSAYAWKQCYNKSIADRLALKEYAVQRAEHHIYELCDLLRNFAQNDSSAGGQTLRRWIEIVDATRKSHYDFEVLVGVAGATGAGKTSLLNAVLNAYELLPSSHEQAATAVSCKVSWNKDPAPGAEVRAVVTFQTFDDVKSHIVTTLRAFQSCEAIENAEYKDESQRINDRAEARSDIKEGMEMITAVWQIPEEDIKASALSCSGNAELEKAAQDFISTKNPAVLELLSFKTQTITSNNAEGLGKLIKPYLDSTTAFHCGSAFEFAIWPLIRNVDIYLQSDILRSGICLVDLPGSGDHVESRAKVADEYRRNLEVTLVVAAIIRAADEKSTYRLLNTSQEMKMAMDKGYNHNSFGVVLTKMDDIDFMGYVKRSKAAIGDPLVESHTSFIEDTQTELKGLAEEKKGHQKAVRELKSNAKRLRKLLRSVPDSVQNQAELRRTEADRESRERRILDIPQLIEAKEKAVKPSKFHLKHWAIIKRNAHVAGKLQRDFERRHAQPHVAKEEEDLEELPALDVMPTSSRKYWDLRHGDKDLDSFPTVQYTGIPALVKWIQRATASRREEHLDVILEGYRNALDGIDNWVKTTKTEVLVQANFDVRELMNALEIDFGNLQAALENELSLFSDEVAQINPFWNPESPKAIFRAQAKKIASEWCLKFFDSDTATDRMAWNTYKGIARRRGGPFRPSWNKDIEYDWIPKLAQPLVKPMIGQWNREINKKLPLLWKPRTIGVELILGDHFKAFMKTIGFFDPSLPAHMVQIEADVLNVQCLVRSKVRKLITSVRKSGHALSSAIESIRDSMETPFAECDLIVGEGSYIRRRQILEDYVDANAEQFFDDAWQSMKDELERAKYRAKQDLEEIAARAANSARNPVELALSNLVGDADSPKKMDAQNQIRARLREWCADWKFPSNCPTHILQMDLAIPSVLRPEDMKASQGDDEDDSSSDSDDENIEGSLNTSVRVKSEMIDDQ